MQNAAKPGVPSTKKHGPQTDSLTAESDHWAAHRAAPKVRSHNQGAQLNAANTARMEETQGRTLPLLDSRTHELSAHLHSKGVCERNPQVGPRQQGWEAREQ